MAFFMVLTSQGLWGKADDLPTAKKNARYHRSTDNAFVLEFDKEPEDWKINIWGQVMWSEEATLLDSYDLLPPYGKKVRAEEKETA